MPQQQFKVPSEEEVEKRRVCRQPHEELTHMRLLTRPQLVGINPETVSNVAATDFPGHYPGEDNSWDLDRFREVLAKRRSVFWNCFLTCDAETPSQIPQK